MKTSKSVDCGGTRAHWRLVGESTSEQSRTSRLDRVAREKARGSGGLIGAELSQGRSPGSEGLRGALPSEHTSPWSMLPRSTSA
jgi:hypothetical protein